MAKVILTEAQIKYLEENYLTVSFAVLRKKVGMKDSTFRDRLKKLGLILPPEIGLQRKKNSGVNCRINRVKKNLFPNYSIYSGVYLALTMNSNKNRMRSKLVAKKNVKLWDLLTDICNALGVTIADVMQKNRKRDVVFCRYIFCYVAKELNPSRSHLELAEFVGYEKHTMSIHAHQIVRDGLKSKDSVFLDYWYRYLQNTTIYKR